MSSAKMSLQQFNIFMKEMKKLNPNMPEFLMNAQNTKARNIDLDNCLINLDLGNIPNVHHIHNSIGDYYFSGDVCFRNLQIVSLPDTICNCNIGSNLDLSGTCLEKLPESFSETQFDSLILDGSSLKTLDNLPDIISGSLSAKNCKEMCDIDGLSYMIIGDVNLQGCNLRGLPDSVIDKTIQGSLCIDKLEYIPRYCFMRFNIFGGICIGYNCYEGHCWDYYWEYNSVNSSLYKDPKHNLNNSKIQSIPSDLILWIGIPSVSKYLHRINTMNTKKKIDLN